MDLIFTETCLAYGESGHPESPQRVRAAWEYLRDKYTVVSPGRIREDDLNLVHTRTLIDAVRNGDFRDFDSPVLPNIYSYALLSVASAVTAMKSAVDGRPAMSITRPPGHHAGRNFLGGFCYFNNLAVAVAIALKDFERVAIIDFDCHHGNGTQDIFLGWSSVRYLSLHQSPFFPGTGLVSERNCLNYPLPAGTAENQWMKFFTEGVRETALFEPELVAVSAGFDSYRGDPFAIHQLEKTTYRKIGSAIADLKAPTFAVLEGGYSEDLGECIEQFLIGFDRG